MGSDVAMTGHHVIEIQDEWSSTHSTIIVSAEWYSLCQGLLRLGVGSQIWKQDHL
jgi:hypothetical protein